MSELTDDRLLPCPFCGGEAKIVEGDESAYVQCLDMKMHRALWFQGDNTAADQVRDQWNRRAAASTSTEAVGVKALEWLVPLGHGDTMTKAESVLGTYRVWTYHGASSWFWKCDNCEQKATLSRETGQAAAQVDYEARVHSCLTPPPAKVKP